MPLSHARLSARMWTAIATLLLLWLAPFSRASAESDRHTFIISDTHFGVGLKKAGVWDEYEDARWPEDLKSFLTYIHSTSNGKADLIINGDIFELWQSRSVKCRYGNPELGCSDAEALKRFQKVVAEHAADIKHLIEFATLNNNRLIFVVGNHDAALLLPSVEKELLKTFAAAGSTFSFESDGLWESADGLVLAEHGHQIGSDPNAFTGWPRPFTTVSTTTHLRRPWGEQFVQEFYNDYETTFPAIDNITDEGFAMRLGFQAAGALGTAEGVAAFAKFAILHESWPQAKVALAKKEEAKATWNVDEERKKGRDFLLESLPAQDALRAALEQADKAKVDDIVKSKISEDDLNKICNARVNRGDGVKPCQGTLGYAASSLLNKPAELVKQRLNALQKRPKVFVYSHTHAAKTFKIVAPDVTVLNTGAWQRLITPASLAARAKRAGMEASKYMAQLTPEMLEACYPFVSIPPYKSEPVATLATWRPNSKTRKGIVSNAQCP